MKKKAGVSCKGCGKILPISDAIKVLRDDSQEVLAYFCDSCILDVEIITRKQLGQVVKETVSIYQNKMHSG